MYFNFCFYERTIQTPNESPDWFPCNHWNILCAKWIKLVWWYHVSFYIHNKGPGQTRTRQVWPYIAQFHEWKYIYNMQFCSYAILPVTHHLLYIDPEFSNMSERNVILNKENIGVFLCVLLLFLICHWQWKSEGVASFCVSVMSLKRQDADSGRYR